MQRPRMQPVSQRLQSKEVASDERFIEIRHGRLRYRRYTPSSTPSPSHGFVCNLFYPMNAMIPGHTSTAYPTDRGNCSEAIRNLNPATSPITPNMKTPPRLSRRAAVLAVLLVPCAFMHAQTAAAPAAATSAEKDDIVVLSPFEVKATSGSNAYTADSTLAGNRLSTQLRDIGSSVTVVTSQFLLDTGATG